MKKLKHLIKNKEGMLLAGVVAVTFILLSSIVWLIGALIVNKTFDALGPLIAKCVPQVTTISQTAVNAYGVVIVIVDVLLLIWWGLSSQKTQSQEMPGAVYY